MLSADAKPPVKTKGKPAASIPSQPGSEPLPPNETWQRLATHRDSFGLQTKLAVSTPDDPGEREADRIADRITRMPAPQPERACATCAGGGVPCSDCQEKQEIQRRAAAGEFSPVTADTSPLPTGAGRPLDLPVRDFFEPRLGTDLHSVRIHTSPEASAAAKELNARAFTISNQIVFGDGMYRPGTADGRRLLAHELVHVVQQSHGPSRANRHLTSAAAHDISRAPVHLARDTPQAELQQAREQSVRGAIDFLDMLRRIVTSDRLRARLAVAQAPGRAEGSRRAHPILNQTVVRERLRRGRGIYDAQRTLLDPNHALQGELRESYAQFLGEVREAFDEALTVAANDRAAELEEQSMYGGSLVLWLEASPLRTAALAGRTRFTSADVAASQRQETDLATVLTTIVPHVNLVQPGMLARARAAIDGSRQRVTASGSGAPQITTATGPTQTAADAAIAQLDGAQRTITRSSALLTMAITRLNAWLQDPTQPSDVPDRIHELFRTRDTGYGTLLRDRLQLMLDHLGGRGSLFVHMHRPADTSTCTTPSTLGQTPRPYEFEFCGNFGRVDRDAGILLHELAHAVIPGRGSRGSAEAGFPLDRAYAGERMLLRMTTEEALNNAESYMQLIAALASPRLPVATIPTETVTGCTDPAPLLDALALAQAAHRRAWSHLDDARAQLRRGLAVEPHIRAQINTHLGTPSDANLLQMLDDFGDIQSDLFTWHVGHTFVCTTGRDCPAGVLGFDDRRTYQLGGATARRRRGSRDPRLCPAFFSLAADDRARSAHALVSLSFGDSYLRRPQNVWGYAALALAIYRGDFGAPPASSLAEHQAADAAAANPPPP